MREIKFRAWEEARKKMHTVTGYTSRGFQFVSVEVEGERDFRILANRLKIMQYTGCRDESGTQIYEGDIIAVYTRAGKLMYREAVKWGYKVLDVNGGEYGFQVCGPYVEAEYLYDCMMAGTCVVEGNIYETPELLNEPR